MNTSGNTWGTSTTRLLDDDFVRGQYGAVHHNILDVTVGPASNLASRMQHNEEDAGPGAADQPDDNMDIQMQPAQTCDKDRQYAPSGGEDKEQEPLGAVEAVAPPARPKTPKILELLDVWANLAVWSYTGVLVRFYTTKIAYLTGTEVMPSLYAQVIGCFAMGFILRHKDAVNPRFPGLYVGMATGFCGSCTTFSSWMEQAAYAWLKWPGTVNDNDYSDWYRVLTFITVLCWGFGMSYAAFYLGREVANLSPWQKPKGASGGGFRYAEEFSMMALFLCLSGLLFSLLVVYSQWEVFFNVLLAPFGSAMRYYVGLWLNKPGRPLGTFTVNMVGCALLGGMTSLNSYNNSFPDDMWVEGLILGIESGFCGSLTTVSTFIVELATLPWKRTIIYAFMSVACAQILYVLTIGLYDWIAGYGPP